MKKFALIEFKKKNIAQKLSLLFVFSIVFGLLSCGSGKNEGVDLIIKYIDQYHEKLEPLEHETFVTHRRKNLESHTDQLVELSKMIVSQIHKGDKVEEMAALEQEAHNLAEYSSEFKKVCTIGKEEDIEQNIKKLRESCDKLIKMSAELSTNISKNK